VSFRPRPLCPRGKDPRYPLDRMRGGPQNRSVRRGEKNILDFTGLELRPLGRPARSQSLYRLNYPGYCLKLKSDPNEILYIFSVTENYDKL
jgi:hypothetical protein